MDIKTEPTSINPKGEFWANAYQANIGKLIGICYRYTGSHQLSEDLAHDAFLKAIEKSESFRGHGNFDAWLRRIVVNHVLQYLRNQKKIPFLQKLTPGQAEPFSMQENISSAPSMEFTTVELLETIDRLPEHHRLVFNLYVMEKFSHAQIGEELGISEGTSKSHLSRARKKLQHLLTKKIEAREQKGNKENATIILLALADDTRTDQMLYEHFEQFSIQPQNPLSLNINRHTGKRLSKKISPKKLFQLIASFSVVIAITLVILFISGRAGNTTENKMNNTASAPPPGKDSLPNEKNKENMLPGPATILQDNVNTGIKTKLKSMKPLDSLALMLALSTVAVHSSALKDSIRNQIQKPGMEIAPGATGSSLPKDQSKPVVTPTIDSAEKGTFRATELSWNKDNLEVDFKGKVLVNFKDQHFQGTGKFNILGKVYLLIVDGQQVPLGKTIKLSDQDYHLAVLNNVEAIAKYGDPGKNGAILIYKSE